ncbi:catalase [Anatilimnocola sp. NA78]|uniref:catalase n=1 Tax=Anatilimnocola sp. NA78 TaxID=3415683 RepID=UPI003CE544C5
MKLARPFTIVAMIVALAVTSASGLTGAEPGRILTEDGGQPVGDNQNSRTAGANGSVLLDNFHLIQKLSRFDRERIPERVVHARGVGAHGEFVSYGDFSKYTRAKLFGAKGTKTPVFLRFSTVIHPGGSPESLRDPRGFAVKFYTEDGNWDLVGNNLPVFFIRDAMKFPDMVHSLKPSPITNQQDPNRFFDFFSHVPESTQMLTFVYSDQGTPANLRQMDGFGVHAFKWVNAEGDVTYVKFNWRSQQGHKTHTAKEAGEATAMNHSNHTEDLYKAIEAKEFPSWELNVQMLKPEQLDGFDFDPLDATKVWTGVPEMKVGKMTLNRVPNNFFEVTEQVAFSPGMVVPGIEPSEDRLLQGRLFSYADTQRYRVGVNYLMLPVNRPLVDVVNNNQAGKMNFGDTKSDVNYQPSVTSNSPVEDPAARASQAPLSGHVEQQRIAKTLNFQQAGELYRSFTAEQQKNLISNLVGDMKKVRDKQIRLRMIGFFYQADADYGTRLSEALGDSLDDAKALVKATKDVEPTKWRQAGSAGRPANTTGGGR